MLTEHLSLSWLDVSIDVMIPPLTSHINHVFVDPKCVSSNVHAPKKTPNKNILLVLCH